MGMGDTFDKVRSNAYLDTGGYKVKNERVAVGFWGGNAYYNEKRTVSSAL
jgi:hypothetical protein